MQPGAGRGPEKKALKEKQAIGLPRISIAISAS
jgi:hypothetical protein